MKYKKYTHENFLISNWSGGETKQLAIYPSTSEYINRDFIWRLSSATVETEESEFTRLPDYDRVLMVLEGQVVLSYNGEKVVKLSRFEKDSFDGGWKTKSFGKITDYNLMIRKGSSGYLESLTLNEEKEMLDIPVNKEYSKICVGVYCYEGYGVIDFCGNTVMLNPGELLTIDYGMQEIEKTAINVMGTGMVIKSVVQYNEMSLGPEIIPKQKGTFEDFVVASKIAHTNFRGSRYIFKRLNEVWFDEALSKSIKKIDRLFLTFIVGIIGLVLTISWFYQNFNTNIMILGIILWLTIDWAVISPLIYFLILPKPISKHIKPIDSLTIYEKSVFEKEKNTNERVNTILKKYKISGRNVYIDDDK